MDNLSQIIQQMKQNNASFLNRLQSIEKSQENSSEKVSEDDLRQLIQDAREIHEGTVLLSYLVYHQNEPVEAVQQEITIEPETTQIQREPIIEPIEEEISEEENLINAQEEALQATQVPIENKEVDEIPSQSELNDEIENSVNELITSHGTVGSLNESISNDDNSIIANLQNNKIQNINTAIGINEKFLFTNELFSGNTEAFIQEIDKLNSFSNFGDAKTYMNTLASNKSWDKESQPFEKLSELVTRRYL